MCGRGGGGGGGGSATGGMRDRSYVPYAQWVAFATALQPQSLRNPPRPAYWSEDGMLCLCVLVLWG